VLSRTRFRKNWERQRQTINCCALASYDFVRSPTHRGPSNNRFLSHFSTSLLYAAQCIRRKESESEERIERVKFLYGAWTLVALRKLLSTFSLTRPDAMINARVFACVKPIYGHENCCEFFINWILMGFIRYRGEKCFLKNILHARKSQMIFR
jgi:hypothetical protein